MLGRSLDAPDGRSSSPNAPFSRQAGSNRPPNLWTPILAKQVPSQRIPSASSVLDCLLERLSERVFPQFQTASKFKRPARPLPAFNRQIMRSDRERESLGQSLVIVGRSSGFPESEKMRRSFGEGAMPRDAQTFEVFKVLLDCTRRHTNDI